MTKPGTGASSFAPGFAHAMAIMLMISSEPLPSSNSAPAGTPLVTGLPDFTALVDHYGPAVVNVQVTEGRQRNQRSSEGFGGPQDPFGDFFRRFGIPNSPQQRNQPPARGVGSGFIVTEDVLGGTITDFVLVSPQKGYAVVLDENLRNLLVAFDPQAGTLLGRIFASQHFLSDVALAPDGTLWLADRTLPRPGIRIFDTLTDEPRGRGTIDVGLPPFSLGFLP